MLNYGYAVLESQVRIAILAAGLNPFVGYFHRQYRGKQTLVFDLMEPMRPVVDRVVLGVPPGAHVLARRRNLEKRRGLSGQSAAYKRTCE